MLCLVCRIVHTCMLFMLRAVHGVSWKKNKGEFVHTVFYNDILHYSFLVLFPVLLEYFTWCLCCYIFVVPIAGYVSFSSSVIIRWPQCLGPCVFGGTSLLQTTRATPLPLWLQPLCICKICGHPSQVIAFLEYYGHSLGAHGDIREWPLYQDCSILWL